jgi:hypothetical protein
MNLGSPLRIEILRVPWMSEKAIRDLAIFLE